MLMLTSATRFVAGAGLSTTPGISMYSVRHLLALLLLPFLLATATAAAEEPAEWISAAKARSVEDISLWTRTIPGAQLKAFRGAMHTDAPMPNVVAMLYDAPNMVQWIFRCNEARILGTADNGDTYVYLRINGIWPVGDRDAIVRVHPVLNARTGEVVVSGTAAPDYIPPAEGYVRIPAIESSWKLTPMTGNLVRVEWTGHVDPAGNIPRWLANTVATLVPRYTLRQVRSLLKEPQWRTPETRDRGTALLGQIRNVIR